MKVLAGVGGGEGSMDERTICLAGNLGKLITSAVNSVDFDRKVAHH